MGADKMKFYWFLLGVLGVWRVTHLVSAEDGPWKLMARFRQRAGNGFWGGLVDCFYCLSLWVAAPVAWWLGEGAKERTLLWLALSGGSILLERATEREAPPPLWKEEDLPVTEDLERGESDVLRTRQKSQ